MRSKRKYTAWLLWGMFVLVLAGILYFSLENQPKYIPSSDYTPSSAKDPVDFEVKLNENMDLLKDRTPSVEELSGIYLFIQSARRNPAAYSRSREMRMMLDLLEKMHAEHAVADQLETLRVAEEAGENALTAGNYEEAIRQLTQAAEIQTDLNNRYRVSPPRDYSRLGRLESKILHAKVQPLLDKSKEYEEQGEISLNAKDWEQAAPLYREAYQLQQQINQLFRASRHRNHYRAMQLLDRLKLAEAGLMYQKAQGLMKIAEERAIAGRTTEASDMYGEAEKELIRLIEQYPANPFVNRSQLRDVLRYRDNLEALPQMRKVLDGADEIGEMLRNGNVAAVLDQLPNVYRDLEEFFIDHPNSDLISTDTRYQIQYLFNARARLTELNPIVVRSIQETTEKGDGVRWSKRPVSQDMYQRIMRSSGENMQNQARPVSAITYSEAVEFCRRLSAISGYSVKLPSTADYEKRMDEQDDAESIFSQLPNGWGEWSWEDDSVPCVVSINPFSATPRPPSTRSPQIGFRFLLQSDEEK
jgi:tetratricopeptide (TPR) repeat protein